MQISYSKLAKLVTYVFFPGNMGLLGINLMQPTLPDWLAATACLVVFPLLVVFWFLRIGYISDLSISNVKQRVVPLLITLLFGFLLFAVSSTILLRLFCISYLVSVSIATICTAFGFKISMHGLGVGAFLGLAVALKAALVWLVLALVLLIMVYWARRVLKAHSHFQLICGAFCGFLVTFVIYTNGI